MVHAAPLWDWFGDFNLDILATDFVWIILKTVRDGYHCVNYCHVPGESSGKVAIWNMGPVREETLENDENVPKLLCQMDNHLGISYLQPSWYFIVYNQLGMS